MFIQRMTAKTALPDFTAVGAAQPMHINFQKDVKGSYEIGCELQRKRVECAIMIKAALAE